MSENKWDIGLGLYLKNNEIEKIQKQIDGIGQAKPITLEINSSEITKQIDNIKKQIQSISSIKVGLPSANNNSNVKMPKIVDGSDTRYIYTVTEAYKDLMNVLRQLNSKETALKKLDIKTDPKQIEVLKKQINELNVEAERLIDTWANKFTLVQNNNINRMLGNDTRGSAQLSAQLADKAKIQENINAYQSLLDLQNQISSKQISIAKLDTGSNANQISQLNAELSELETKYQELRNQLSGKLSIGQLQELDNVSKTTAQAIDMINAKLADLNSAKASNDNIKALQSQFQNLINISKQIGNIKIKIQGLENSGESSNQISQLNAELKDLEVTFNTLYNDFYNNAGFLELESSGARLNSVFEETEYKLKELQSAYEDTRAKFANRIQTDFIDSGKLTTDISKLNADFQQLGIESNEITDNIHTLRTLLSQMDGNDDIESVIADYEKFQQILISTINKIKEQQIQLKQGNDTAKLVADRNKLSRDIELWFKRNTGAAKQFGDKMREIQAQVQTADGTKLNALKSEFQAVATEAKIAGDNALTFGDRLKAQVSKLSVYFSGIMLITKGAQVLKNMINQVVFLDTALIDLKKTTTATDEELRKFYFDANKTGKELGVTTQNVIQAAADWSRLGYSLKDAQEMAKTSSIFSSISPGVDIEKATDGLVSAMKANVYAFAYRNVCIEHI